jgi:hypothetical protein
LPHSTTRTIETETPRKRLDDIYKMLEWRFPRSRTGVVHYLFLQSFFRL